MGFGGTYANPTGIEGGLFLTGTDTFLVREIRVFEFVPSSPEDLVEGGVEELLNRCD
jgi:hypothetical protein